MTSAGKFSRLSIDWGNKFSSICEQAVYKYCIFKSRVKPRNEEIKTIKCQINQHACGKIL